MSSERRRKYLLVAPVVAAAVLAAGLVGVSLLAAASLRARDVAVREGLLVNTGHDLEALLREDGPEKASETLARFGAAQGDLLRGLEVAGPAGPVAAWGARDGEVHEIPAMLGPEWRNALGFAGPGRGSGFRAGPVRGSMRPGPRPPLVLRLFAAPEAGSQRNLARALVFGSAASGAALVLLAIGAARGIVHSERLERLEAERQRLDALALAGAGLAHRLRNPLAAIKGTAQLVADEPGAPAEARALRIVEASERIDALLAQLLKFARPPEPQVEPFDLSATARDVAARAAQPVRVDAGHEVRAAGDRGHAAEILDELVANARAHDPDGEIVVAVRSEGDAAVAEVLDRGSGLGVDPSRAFDPYVTTRPGGTGLGLPIVRALARASGGDVMLSPREQGGCAARLTLRRAGAS